MAQPLATSAATAASLRNVPIMLKTLLKKRRASIAQCQMITLNRIQTKPAGALRHQIPLQFRLDLHTSRSHERFHAIHPRRQLRRRLRSEFDAGGKGA
jgi:hypothetical protein